MWMALLLNATFVSRRRKYDIVNSEVDLIISKRISIVMDNYIVWRDGVSSILFA